MKELPDGPPAGHVLVVDDEKSIRVCLCAFLTAAGYHTDVAENAPQALELLSCGYYNVVVTDVVLPGLSGVELLRHVRQTCADVQVIVMTGDPTVETAAESLRSGAMDYLAKPVGKNAIVRSVANAVRIRRLDDERRRLAEENVAYQRNLERLVRERTLKLEETLRDWKDAAEGTILAMATVVETRDPYTAGHQARVARLARAIGEKMGLPEEGLNAVFYAGLVHDIGKISIPAEILSHPAKLCDEAMSLVKKHSKTGYRILEKIKFPWPIAQIVFEHHERLDGSGYPQGLLGSDTSQEGRILAVADVVEAMASHRPYRPALGVDAALSEIEKGRARLYDADAVDACVRLFREDGYSLAETASASVEPPASV